MFYLDHTYQKSITHVQIMQKILTLLCEYSDNYSMTSGSLQNYYRNGINDDAMENDNANDKRIKNNKTITSKSFEYKTKIIGKTPNI